VEAVLAERNDPNEEAPSAPYVWVDMADWHNQPRPHVEYTVPGRIPLRQAMLFSGEGGGGKSTVIKQLCAGTVLNRFWLGALPEKGPAFFIEAEDEERIMHARMYDICVFYQVKFADLIAGGLHMISRAGEDSVMAAPNRDGKIVPTHFYQHIMERAGDIKPKIIGIASAANVFAGNEISRPQVQQFAGLLTRLAKVANGSVVLAMHPSLTGINTGTGLSGTTQWHNAFRARAYLDVPKLESGEPDPAVRELKFLKNQYGRMDETITLQYQNGLFLPISPSGADASPLGKISQDAIADDVFVTILRRFTRENRNASHSPGNSYAPALFAQEKEAIQAGLKSKTLAAAMRRLFEVKKIENKPYGRPSRPNYRLAVKEDTPNAG